MNLLRSVREVLTQRLWRVYRTEVHHAALVDDALQQEVGRPWFIDHFAIIDLPSPQSGLHVLRPLFLALGYEVRGEGYLPDKQNGFVWMAEVDATSQPVGTVLPQIVIADFELNAVPENIKKIVKKYTAHLSECPLEEVQRLSQRAQAGDPVAADSLIETLTCYFSGVDRVLPTVSDFQTVEAFNELMAWCLAFGRRPNHFTVSVHTMEHFTSLSHFNQWIENELNVSLNKKGGAIQGGCAVGIEQSATQGALISVPLSDGTVALSERFMEFVWRFPQTTLSNHPKWGDYFTGFIPANANQIIESVYKESIFS